MPAVDDNVRPWGRYDVLAENQGFKVKSITVAAGKRLSYQRHARRSEHWFIVQGCGLVTLDDRTVAVERGNPVEVPVGVCHRIENTGSEELIFIEVQHGDYFGEDDIERLDDDYGRVS